MSKRERARGWDRVRRRAAGRFVAALGAGAMAMAVCAAVAAGDPKVPPAVEPGNRVPVAILTAGFDYTRAEIAARLARDGEGEIIAWDVAGNDRFPFDPAGDTELLIELAGLLPADAPVSLLAVKVDMGDPVSLAKGLAFVARTPARTVLVPMWSSNRQTWEAFEQAAQHFGDLRLVVRACAAMAPGGGTAVYPRDLNLASAAAQPPKPGDAAEPIMAYVAELPCERP